MVVLEDSGAPGVGLLDGCPAEVEVDPGVGGRDVGDGRGSEDGPVEDDGADGSVRIDEEGAPEVDVVAGDVELDEGRVGVGLLVCGFDDCCS